MLLLSFLKVATLSCVVFTLATGCENTQAGAVDSTSSRTGLSAATVKKDSDVFFNNIRKDSLYKRFGFNNLEELDRVKIKPEPIKLYGLTKGEDVRFVEYMFLAMVDEEPRALISVSEIDGDYVISGIGGANIVKHLANVKRTKTMLRCYELGNDYVSGEEKIAAKTPFMPLYNRGYAPRMNVTLDDLQKKLNTEQ